MQRSQHCPDGPKQICSCHSKEQHLCRVEDPSDQERWGRDKGSKQDTVVCLIEAEKCQEEADKKPGVRVSSAQKHCSSLKSLAQNWGLRDDLSHAQDF